MAVMNRIHPVRVWCSRCQKVGIGEAIAGAPRKWTVKDNLLLCPECAKESDEPAGDDE